MKHEEENQKLKEQLYKTQEDLASVKEDSYNQWKAKFEKLKAENEELLSKKSILEGRLYELAKDKLLLQQEITPLRELKEYIEDLERVYFGSSYKIEEHKVGSQLYRILKLLEANKN